VRCLVTVSDWPAHWLPGVPLLRALRDAGHDVIVACAASQESALRATGLPVAGVLGDLDMMFLARLAVVTAAARGDGGDRELLDPLDGCPLPPSTGPEDLRDVVRRGRLHIVRETARGAQAVLDLAARTDPDLVLHDRLSLDGILVGRYRSVPHVAWLWGPVGTAETDPRLTPLPVDHTGVFARHGLPPLHPDLVEHVLDPCPADLAPPTRAHRTAVRYEPCWTAGPGAEPEPLPADGEGRWVCVVWSDSVRRSHGTRAHPVARVVEAAGRVPGARVLLLGDPGDVLPGPLPPWVHAAGRRPLADVLPHCAAVVHHGGAGVTMTSVVAGVPQLAVTSGAEEDADGRRLAATGAGRHVRTRPDLPGGVDVPDLVDALTRLLHDPAHTRAARRLRRQALDRPAPADVVPRLEEIATGSRVPA
jgi:hypothetical protein